MDASSPTSSATSSSRHGLVVARKGELGVGGDAIWMALGATNGTGAARHHRERR